MGRSLHRGTLKEVLLGDLAADPAGHQIDNGRDPCRVIRINCTSMHSAYYNFQRAA